MKEQLQLFKSVATVVFVAILLVFTLCIQFGTFAWFAKSENVKATGFSISAHGENTIESIRYYRVSNTKIDTDETGAKHNIYMFGYDESILSSQMLIKPDGTAVQERTSFETAVSMNPYSELSGDCQVLLEITLHDQAPVYLNAETAQNSDFLGNIVSNKTANETYDLDPNNLPLSSVVRFSIFTSLNTELDEQTKVNSFLVEEDVLVTQQYTFIQTKTVNEQKQYTFANPYAGSHEIIPVNRKFYIFFDYHSPLVEYLNEQILDYVDKAEHAAEVAGGKYTTIILGETNLHFVPDFGFHISDVAEGN